MWSSTRILWDEQVMLMWVLLPPIFIVCMLIALAAPFLVQKSVAPSAENDKSLPDRAAVADRRA